MSEPDAQRDDSREPSEGQGQPRRQEPLAQDILRQGPPRQEPPRRKQPNSSRRTLIGIIGGLLITGLAGVLIVPNIVRDKPPVVGEESTLDVLVPGDINLAMPTLDPGTSKQAVDDAKNCKAPLAWVTLTQRNGHGGMVRVRSGQYLSPPIKLTPVPQRIAVPYPAPYPMGRGVLTLVGEADQVGFFLRPGGIHDVNGGYSVNVHWQVRNPCPS